VVTARRLLAAAVCLLLLAGVLALRSRAARLPGGAAEPDRISWCGRDFSRVRGQAPWTRDQVDSVPSALPGDAPYPTTQLGLSPAEGGRPLLAKLTPDAERLGLPCTMELYLKVGPDSYRPYELVGGP
jgi:hypothetical protein